MALGRGRKNGEPQQPASQFWGSPQAEAGEKSAFLPSPPPGGSKEQQSGVGPHLQDVSAQVLLKDFGDQRHGTPAAWGWEESEV